MPEWRSALQDELPLKSARSRKLGYGLVDLLVVAACTVTFAVVVGAGKHVEAKGPPIGLIARDLGTTPEQFQKAADRFLPRFPHRAPTEAQKKQFATTLNVSVEQLDTVMEKYRPDRLRQQ
jgi:hypothetical protein